MAGILQTEVDPQMVLALIARDRAAQECLFKQLSGPVFTINLHPEPDDEALTVGKSQQSHVYRD